MKPKLTGSVKRKKLKGQDFGILHTHAFLTGEFDDMGIAEGDVDEGIGAVKSLRLNVHVESDNWAILSEVRHTGSLFLLVSTGKS